MAKAKRHYLPGHIWHITHRCHKKEFLLRFARDLVRALRHRVGLVRPRCTPIELTSVMTPGGRNETDI